MSLINIVLQRARLHKIDFNQGTGPGEDVSETMSSSTPYHAIFLPLTRFAGIVAPTLYCGTTAQCMNEWSRMSTNQCH